MDSDIRWLLRVAATTPLWLLRYIVARQHGQVWLTVTILVDVALVVASWRAVVPSAVNWPGRGDPASVETFVYVPAALAAVFTAFDVVRLLRQLG